MMILKTSRSNLSSNDQLALDLPFAATKSLTARVGPTPTFTRGSGATYIGSDGLIHGVDTSNTSNTIGTGSRTFTLAATAGQDQFWRTGDAVEASNGSNSMVGTVTSYTPSTQVLVCNMTSIGGSGTFTSWRIGYRGPRFDHTSAGVCRGLLIEESRTNLCLQSEDMNSATWGKVNGTISNNFGTSPDGTTNADKFVEDSALTGKYFRQANLVTIANGTVYTWSVYAKADGRNFCSVQGDTSSGFLGTASFDLLNGTVGAVTAGATATIQSVGNGWYRLAVTSTSTGTGVRPGFLLRTNATGTTTQNYQGDGVSGVLFWGAQLEAGSFATSYIPTTTGTAARSADVCSITAGAFSGFYNNSAGTIVAVASAVGFATSNNSIVAIDSGTTAVLRLFNRTAQGNRLSSQVSSVLLTPAANYNTANVVYKSAISADATGADFVIDGTQIPDSYTGASLSADNLKFTGASGSTSNNTISSIRYYKKRLSVSKLQALTV